MSKNNHPSRKAKKGYSGPSTSRKPAPFHSVMSSPLKKIHEGAEGSTPSAPTAATEATTTAAEQQQQRAEGSTTRAQPDTEQKQQLSPSAPDSDNWKQVVRPPTPPRAPKQRGDLGSGQPPSPVVGDNNLKQISLTQPPLPLISTGRHRGQPLCSQRRRGIVGKSMATFGMNNLVCDADEFLIPD